MNKQIQNTMLAAALLLSTEVLTAQVPGSAFSLYGGVAITAGNFAKEGGTTFPAWVDHILSLGPLQNPGFPGSGCARAGFMAGMQYTSGGSIGWIINAAYEQNNVSHNPPWRSPSYGSVTIETDSWKSASILTGIKFGTTYSHGPNAFIAPLIGVMYIKSPNITATIAGSGPTESVQLKSASGIAMTYGAAVEFTIWRHLTWGVRYIYSTPHFDIPYTTTSGTNSQNGSISHQQSTSIVLSYIGYSF